MDKPEPWFRKGQIVAVRQSENDAWVPAVFQATVEDESDRKYKARRLGYATFGVRWRYCTPAQHVWPWMAKMRARIILEDKEVQDAVWRKSDKPTLDTGAFAKSLKSLAFFLGGTHVAGLVEEAEQAAWKGQVVRYE